jgi:predicted NBD/HSP70 family sugar kinase
MTVALGIDLGGTKIEIIGLDQRGAVLLRRRQPSPRGSYEATLAAIRTATCSPGSARASGTSARPRSRSRPTT